MENCFESMSALSDLSTGWIWNTRNPTASSPLLVDVGPGEFGPFSCSGDGFVTLRGAGREASLLIATGSTGNAVVAHNCESLEFLDLGFHGGQYGVHWIGKGSASWTNVDIVTLGTNGISYAWFDECDSQVQEKSLHYVHGSRVRNAATASSYTNGWATSCAETWFFGGEILVTLDAVSGLQSTGVEIQQGAVLQTFGTPIRIRATANDPSLTIYAVKLTSTNPEALSPYVGSHRVNAAFHSHGGVLSAQVASAANQSIHAVGIWSDEHAMVHTPATAFVVSGGSSGTTTRISGGGHMTMDVFQWQAGPYPPQSMTESNRITSLNGHDIWVENDCDDTGDCADAGNETHLMIYNAAQCGTSNPWFDTRTGACRQ